MNATSPRTSRVGSVASAAIGVVALVACLAVVVLTDDDLAAGGQLQGGGLGGSSSSGTEGLAPRASGSGGSTEPPTGSCTRTTCPGTGLPTDARGDFPYPPGTTEPEWNDASCPDIYLSPGTTWRQVRMPLNKARDWYLTNLVASGYGWGPDAVQANPFTTGSNGQEIVLGWDSRLMTMADEYGGNLALERDVGRQSLCGPPPGTVFIKVRLP